MRMRWLNTGARAPADLVAARLQLHYGALLLGSVAHAVLEHAADDSHTNLGFDPQRCSLGTHPLSPDRPSELHLDLRTQTLIVRDGSADVAGLALAGVTLADALAWFRDGSQAWLGRTVEVPLREYPDFPSSPLADGAAFADCDVADLDELARWFANGLGLFEPFREESPAMSALRVWPHHFDLGALLPIAGERMIGLGMSPGDDTYDQPYFYCSPYPQPEAGERPPLSVGHWHDGSFVSAILTAGELHDCAAQPQAAREYSVAAVQACRDLLTDAH